MRYRLGMVALAALLLAACQRQNEVQLTLIAQNATLQAEIGAVRQTATVDAERLQITVDYMGTLVGRAQEDRVQLQATLVARGTDPASIANAAPQFTTPATPGPQNNGLPPTPDTAPEQTEQVAPPSQPALTDITMAPGVGNDDCALNPTANFTTDTPEIYIVATGRSIPAGTNIAATFSIAGQDISHDFAPDFDIDGACVWFYIDQTDLEFREGTWSVELFLNGTPASAPIPFTITAAEAVTEGG